ncbi:MAG: hypothetical protein R2834_05105 [Rhodothermales bacterium]
MNPIQRGVLALLILAFAGCGVFEEKDEPERDFMAEIQEHAAAFVQEAGMRGIDVSASMATVVFKIEEEILYEGRSLCGLAPWYADPQSTSRTISIVVNERCWTTRPVEDNEALIFHELGHMVLDRFHRDDLLPNNSRSSLMVSGNLAGIYAGNARPRRTYYVDELFDAETPVPDWALE